MVGGIIIGLTTTAEWVHAHVADCPHWPKHGDGAKCPRPDTCCVRLDPTRKDGSRANLQIGDSLWWQCGFCYWTPRTGDRCGVDYDIPLRKIGFSH
jgi:hypothetical protein